MKRIKRKQIGFYSRAGKIFLLLLCFTILIQPAVPQAEASPAQSAPPVQAEPAAEINLDGNLTPRQWVNVGFSQSGDVTQLLVREGATVEAGQVLARQGDLESLQAALDADQFRLLKAQQALKDLNDGAAHRLALIDQDIAQTDKTRALAESRLRSLKKLPDPMAVQQAYGNMKTDEQKLEDKRKELRKAQKLWDPTSSIWRFIPRRAYKLYLLNLEKQVAQAEVRYQQAIDKYNDRQKPADPIDLAQTEAKLALAEAQLQKAQQERSRWLNGPDPEKVAQLEAEIQAAQSALIADQARLDATQLIAPIGGTVVSLDVKQGEWAAPNQTVLTIADLSNWRVEMDNLTEDEVVTLKPGLPLTVTFDALPGTTFSGQLETVGMLYVTQHGDTRFTAKADLQGNDPRLRWGMSATLVEGGNQ
ncbi:MAG: efflux RND transporter periplasmic adaptor subunit [Anaerolineales bacterium]